MAMTPLQLAFYKGITGKWGALQLNYQKPHYYVKSNPKLKNYEGRFIPQDWLVQNSGLTERDLTSREGALFLEITNTKDKNVYDWENKITMALSIHDMGKVLVIIEGGRPGDEMTIMHDPGAKSPTAGKIQKYLKISTPKGIKEGAMVTVTQKNADGDTVSHTVPLSGDEAKVFSVCLRSVIPNALGW